MTKKINQLLMLTAALILFWPHLTQAAEVKSGENIYLSANETIEGNLYAASNNITVDGEIKGDLIAAAQTITINGRLDGDLIAAAQTITVNGEINGNVRVAANSANIQGQVARNVNFIGNTIILGPEAKIGWDVLSGAASTEIMGTVGGSVYGSSDYLLVAGSIGKDFNFRGSQRTQNITLTPSAKISGHLYYQANGKLELEDGATVTGEIKQLEPSTQNNKTSDRIWPFLYNMLAAILVGLILIGPGKNILMGMYHTAQEKTLTSLIWGLILVLIIPVVAILLMITVIGLPLSLVLLGLWLMSLWMGEVVGAIFIGQFLLKTVAKKQPITNNLYLAMIGGIIIAYLLFALPYAGWLLSLAAISMGVGAFILYLRRQ